MTITSFKGWAAHKNASSTGMGRLAMLKKLILSAALFFGLAAGTAVVLTIEEQPAAAKEPCVNCSSVKRIPAHLVSLPQVW
jgi:hypothetical protein